MRVQNYLGTADEEHDTIVHNISLSFITLVEHNAIVYEKSNNLRWCDVAQYRQACKAAT